MPSIAVASIVSLLVSCAGMRPGLSRDGSSASSREQDGCVDESQLHCSGGRGYDELALAVTTLAVAGVLVPRLLRKLR